MPASCSGPRTAQGALDLARSEKVPPPPQKKLHQYSIDDTPISVLLQDPAARAVLVKYLPVLASAGPDQLGQISSSSLRAIQGYGAGILTDQVMDEIKAGLTKVTASIPYVEPANTTDESRVKPYTLPAVLTSANCQPVRTAADWWSERRPEIYGLFQTLEFGRAPGRPADEYFTVTKEDSPALDGKATEKQTEIHLSKDPSAPVVHLAEFFPAQASGRSPMLLMLGFTPATSLFQPATPMTGSNDTTSADLTAADAEKFLDAGIGIAYYDYTDVDPDSADGYVHGIRSFYAKGAPQADRSGDAWGSLAAWAWSASRVQDYLETDTHVQANRVAVLGVSRLGKTALWAAASDQRFAAVIASSSGKIGASLVHRNFGDSYASAPAYWTAKNFTAFSDHPDALPMDSHMLLALVAPRPVLLQTSAKDYAGDPKGEFLAAVAAGPVYRLLGANDLGATQWPPSKPILNNLGYTMNSGGHGPAPGDWDIFVKFLQSHLL